MKAIMESWIYSLIQKILNAKGMANTEQQNDCLVKSCLIFASSNRILLRKKTNIWNPVFEYKQFLFCLYMTLPPSTGWRDVLIVLLIRLFNWCYFREGASIRILHVVCKMLFNNWMNTVWWFVFSTTKWNVETTQESLPDAVDK